MAPPMSHGATAAGLPLEVKRFQVQPAVRRASARRIAVLLTVPWMLIASSARVLPKAVNTFSFNVGFAVRIVELLLETK
jgi:hypothetical protein